MSKPAQLEDRPAERSIGKPLADWSDVDIGLWRKPKTNAVLPQGCMSATSQGVDIICRVFKDPCIA